jgi:CheY-like chemotaxis protein
VPYRLPDELFAVAQDAVLAIAEGGSGRTSGTHGTVGTAGTVGTTATANAHGLAGAGGSEGHGGAADHVGGTAGIGGVPAQAPGAGSWSAPAPEDQGGSARLGADAIAAAAASAATVPADSALLDRSVLVFEGASGGLLTLLAHSAISDLAEINGTVRVRTATTPAEGIALLAAEPFRCVVADVGLEHALEFLEQIREKPELLEVPVLAHAAVRPEDGPGQARLAALRSSGPPLELLSSLDDLRERITLHLSAAQRGQVPALVGETTTPADSVQASHPSLRGKHILVIDDDARGLFAITSTLEQHGMRVTHKTNGREGIEALLASGVTDLILMDVMMPGMDGYATMTAIRRTPQFARLPMIAVTARAMPGDREKSLAAGASDHVTKPVDTEELLGCMERWLTS